MKDSAGRVIGFEKLNFSIPESDRLRVALLERDRTDPALAEYAEILYGQAILAEGGQLPDPAAFSQRIADLLLRVV